MTTAAFYEGNRHDDGSVLREGIGTMTAAFYGRASGMSEYLEYIAGKARIAPLRIQSCRHGAGES